MRKNISSGAVWEDRVGYSRAVRVGNHIAVTGTVAVNEHNQCVGVGDEYAQAAYILKKISDVLSQADASLSDVIRTRIFVTNIANWEAVGQAHRECFGEIRPATTMVEVKSLIGPEFLVEIEVDAVVERS